MSKQTPASQRDWDKEFEEYLNENKTLAYMMLKKSEEFADSDALTQKVNGEWISIKWRDFGEQIRAVAKALLEMDILQPGEMAGIFSANRIEWAVADLGILATRAVCVPIYATNSAEEAEYIVNDAEIRYCRLRSRQPPLKLIKRQRIPRKIVAFDRNIKIDGNDSIPTRSPQWAARQRRTQSWRLNTVNQRYVDVDLHRHDRRAQALSTTDFMNGIYPSYMRFPASAPSMCRWRYFPQPRLRAHVVVRLHERRCAHRVLP